MPFAMDMLATRMEHTSEAKYVSAESPSTCTANLCVTLRPLREIKISVDSVHSVCPKYVLLFFCQKICVFRAFCVRLNHAECGRTNRASLQKPRYPLRSLILCLLCEKIKFCVNLWFLCATLPCGWRTHEPCVPTVTPIPSATFNP